MSKDQAFQTESEHILPMVLGGVLSCTVIGPAWVVCSSHNQSLWSLELNALIEGGEWGLGVNFPEPCSSPNQKQRLLEREPYMLLI